MKKRGSLTLLQPDSPPDPPDDAAAVEQAPPLVHMRIVGRHGVVLLESVHFYASRLEAARVLAELLRAGKHFMVPATFPRVLFTDANNRAITVDLSGEGNA